jgi:hypothetical protein
MSEGHHGFRGVIGNNAYFAGGSVKSDGITDELIIGILNQ